MSAFSIETKTKRGCKGPEAAWLTPHAGGKGPEAAWFALHVRSNHERLTADALACASIEAFYPCYLLATLERPLFPGYVFARFGPDDRVLAGSRAGVVRILGAGGAPEPIDPMEIESVKRLMTSGLAVPYPYLLQPGERVTIERGPLAGATGTIVRAHDALRVVVSIHLLNRSIAAEVEAGWLAPLAATKP